MGKYKTILIDPPWPVEAIAMKRRPNSTTMPYQTMSVDEIGSLAVGGLADDTCDLFLWTTHTYLPDAFDLMKRWGFKYHCVITWDKGNGYSVNGFTRRTEFLLYGYKNKMGVRQRGRYVPTLIRDLPELFDEKRNAHSRKPLQCYRLLERATQEPRIELFARHRRVGWHVWGNEVESDGEVAARLTTNNA